MRPLIASSRFAYIKLRGLSPIKFGSFRNGLCHRSRFFNLRTSASVHLAEATAACPRPYRPRRAGMEHANERRRTGEGARVARPAPCAEPCLSVDGLRSAHGSHSCQHRPVAGGTVYGPRAPAGPTASLSRFAHCGQALDIAAFAYARPLWGEDVRRGTQGKR